MEFLRKEYGKVWANAGEVISPSSAKIDSGWVLEMMPYQWENWLTNRQDEAISYILQKGIPEYLATQEYIANKSVVTYNGNLYIATSNVTGVLPTVTTSWKRINIISDSNGVVSVLGGGTGATTASGARLNLGLGTISTSSAPTTNGIVVKDGADSLISRIITGTSGNIVVTNPDGVAGNININVGTNIAQLNQDSSWTSRGSIKLPSGSTAEQGTAVPGKIRFDLEQGEFKGAYSDGWRTLSRPAAASETPITDSGNYFVSANVEGALQELGTKFKIIDTAILSYPSYAAAVAAVPTLANGQNIEVKADETKAGRTTRYVVQSSSLQFRGGSGIWSVWDFGAIGDNVTDDSEAFRAAGDCEGQAVLIPWTPNGYKIEGTIPTKCRFIGLGKPSINLTVRGGDHRGYWLKSNSGLENLTINRYTAGSSVSGEFNNAFVIGEYFSPTGTLYENIKIRDVDLIGFDGGVGRRSISGIYGNSRDIDIQNLRMSGYISYGLMIHWGGAMGEDVNTSPVTASWHPRRIKIDGLSMTSPQPDEGLGMLYISAGHDIEARNLYSQGVRNPVTIAPGDVGGIVAQGESVGRVLSNISLEGLTLLDYVGTGLVISGVAGLRAGQRWLATDTDTATGLRVRGLTISRPPVPGVDASGRMIDVRMFRNAVIEDVNLYHTNDGYTENGTPAIFVQTSEQVSISGRTRVPFASEVSGGRDVVINTNDTCLRTDYPGIAIGCRLSGEASTATTTTTVSAGATSLELASLSMDILPGSPVVLPSSLLVVYTTRAVASNTGPVSLPITPMPVSLASGATITMHRNCDNVKVYGRGEGFYQSVLVNNAAGGSARGTEISRKFRRSGIYDIYARNAEGLSIHGCDFRNGNQLESTSGGNIRLIDSCSGVDIAPDNTFEHNDEGTTKVPYNVYVFSNSEAVSIAGKYYAATTAAINHFDPTGNSMRPAIGKCWFAPGVVPIIPVAGVAKTTTIGEMQIGHGTAAPTTGVWKRGDIVFNTSAAASGKAGWICTTSGTPGTWKAFASIDA